MERASQLDIDIDTLSALQAELPNEVTMTMNLQDYFISEKHAFVLEDPLEKLPEYFEPWNRTAKDMPDLVAAGSMRQAIHEMPLLDWRLLEGHRQKRLAHLQLTIMASGYVWQDGDAGASKVLPACVAVPLCGVSEDLGILPVLSNPGFILANYTLIDRSKPFELGNLRTLYDLPGGKDSEWFCLVSILVEKTLGNGIKSVVAAVEGVECNDEAMVISSMIRLTQVVADMQKGLSRMHERLSATVFFNYLRPFTAGWGGKDNPLTDGLIFEGVSEEPIKTNGGSAAQSSTLQVLDALMGVQHSAEKNAFMVKMRDHMPPAHRRFIIDLENRPKSLRDMVNSSGNTELHEAYNMLLSAMISFRSYHIQLVTKYVSAPSAKARRIEERKHKSLDKIGAGGTNLIPFLKEIRDDTKDSIKHA